MKRRNDTQDNTSTVSVKESGTEHSFKVTSPTKDLENGRHYSSLASNVPGDNKTVTDIEIPRFDDAGEAFQVTNGNHNDGCPQNMFSPNIKTGPKGSGSNF